MSPLEVGNAVIAVAGLGSVGLWVWLATRTTDDGHPLPLAPRRPVPWGPGFGIIAVFWMMLGVLTAQAPASGSENDSINAAAADSSEGQPGAGATDDVAPTGNGLSGNGLSGNGPPGNGPPNNGPSGSEAVGGGAADRETGGRASKLSDADYVRLTLQTSAAMLLLVAAVVGAIVLSYGGGRHDLGLPTSGQQLLSDVGLGLAAALAVLAPVYLTQLALTQLAGWAPHHPSLDQLSRRPTWSVGMATVFAAAVVAPIVEEVLFRLLLQGWLEKAEDQRLGALQAPRGNRSSPAGVPEGRPTGWAPVIVSSLCFSLAHFTHGPAPVALFFFGLVLGYVYQRTHRIVPCVVAHMAFNALSLSLHWLTIIAPAAGN
ncbi:MAG: CPBP family intramembrane glutamic endopeptidase [Planctomycetota bacterium]